MEISLIARGAGASEDGARHLGKSDGGHRQVRQIRFQCARAGCQRGGFCEHWARLAQIAVGRHRTNEALTVHIRAVYQAQRLRVAMHLAGTVHPRCRQEAGATLEAAARHSGTRQAASGWSPPRVGMAYR